MTKTTRFPCAVLVALLAGCGSPKEHVSTLDDEENVRTWANTASSVAVWANVHAPMALADGQDAFTDPDCPVISDDGTTVTIAGGCTDSQGDEWTGTATVVRSGEDRSATLDDYGRDAEHLGTVRGTFDLTETNALTHEFDADLVHDGGLTTTITYSGSIEGDWSTATTWNGSGTATRDGMVEPVGTIEAETVDELLDDTVCAGQALSGETTIHSGDHVAVVTYDGATDCDEDEAATWTYDGEDRGLVTDVVCSALPVPGRPVHVDVLVLVLVLVVGGRFRPRARARDTSTSTSTNGGATS